MIIVEDKPINVCDQLFHDFEIARQKPELCVVRKTLTQIANEATLSDSKDLIVYEIRVRTELFLKFDFYSIFPKRFFKFFFQPREQSGGRPL